MAKTVGIIGGDKRFLFAGDFFLKDKYNVKLFGFSKITSTGNLQICNSLDELSKTDIVIFPVPPVNQAGDINAPFAKEPIKFNSELLNLISDKKIFCPMKEKIVKFCKEFENIKSYDYFEREDFTLLNAYLTAEGALQIALNSYEGAILDSKILICGFGRIGKCLAKMFRDLKAQVYVSARKATDFAKITINGYHLLNTGQLKELRGFDIVFNTVPALIFDESLLKKTDKNTLIVDLASLPGGIDKSAAQSLDIDIIHALALPGKTAPKTAGEIIKNTIVKMLEEEIR